MDNNVKTNCNEVTKTSELKESKKASEVEASKKGVINITDKYDITPDDVPTINYDDFKPIFKFDDMSDEDIINGALNRLVQDTYFGINGLPLLACFIYVYNKARVDVKFAKQICIRSKNFTKAFQYLSNEVKSIAAGSNNGVGLDHRQIFEILDEYYALDDAEIAKKEAEAEAKRKAQLNAAKAKTKKSTERTAAKSKDKKSLKSKSKEKEKISDEQAQMNLYSLLGGSE